jgi:hypothetical protein
MVELDNLCIIDLIFRQRYEVSDSPQGFFEKGAKYDSAQYLSNSIIQKRTTYRAKKPTFSS